MPTFFDIISNRVSSDRTGEPFSQCSLTGDPLSPTEMYVICKAYQDGKCILEAAQGMTAQLNAREYASEQSIENLFLYSGRRFNQFLQDRHFREAYHLEDPACLITGEELAPSDAFELYTFNIPGENLGECDFLFVGPTAVEQMSELLSDETRKSWGRYTEQLAPEAPDIVVSPMFIG